MIKKIKIKVNDVLVANVLKDVETGVVKIKYTKEGNGIKLKDNEILDLINKEKFLKNEINCHWN
jgi:hypothetical protein